MLLTATNLKKYRMLKMIKNSINHFWLTEKKELLKQSKLITQQPKLYKIQILTLFRMGSFGAVHGRGAKKHPLLSLKSVTHILQWWKLTVISYLKKIQKIYESRDTYHESCWHQQFFTGNHQILQYQKIHV